MPDLSLEGLYADRHGVDMARVCGVDEAGRGPWAGPVCAAAVILDPGNLPFGIDDSKKLTHATREQLYEEIVDKALAFHVALVSAAEIDDINILQATYLAMARAINGLAPAPALALVDGNRLPPLDIPAVAIVGGDGLSLSIGAASILAKVTRDRFMVTAEKDYPGYGFARHKGYGVPEHAAALTRLGPCPLHRVSFKPVAASLNRRGS